MEIGNGVAKLSKPGASCEDKPNAKSALAKAEHTRAGKNRKTIKAALACLRDEDSDGDSAVELQGLIEQACNYYLAHGCFPETYEEMQPIPVLKVGILPYAADDGGEQCQAHRFR